MSANAIYSILSKREYAHNEPIYCCDWVKADSSGDGKDIIATGGLDCLVKVWSLQNDRLELLYEFEGHKMAVVAITISPKLTTCVSISLDSNLILWNLKTGTKITDIAIGSSDAWKVAFSPSGEHIATGGTDGKVYVHSVEDGTVEKMIDTRGQFIMSIDWSRHGKYVATGSHDGVITLMDMHQGKLFHTIEAHRDAIRSIKFSPSDKEIASASQDGYVKIFGVVSGGLLCKLDHKTWATAVCYSPDGMRVASGDGDGKVRVALTHDLTVLNTFEEHSETVWGVRFDSNNKRLLSISKDGNINLYECPPVKE